MIQPLTCKELVELITEYLEGTLSEDDHACVDEHLAGCEGCTNYLEQMRQSIRLTGSLREENLSPEQREDLLQLFRDWKKK